MLSLWAVSTFLPYLLVLAFFTVPSTGADFPKYLPIRRSCGADSPSYALKSSHQWLRKNEPLKNNLWDSSAVQQRYERYAVDHSKHGHNRRQTLPFAPLYIIDTYIHIVDDTTSANPESSTHVTDQMIQDQFKYLNAAFRNASIGYRLMGIERTTNDTWASNGDDLGMKRALRRGTYSSLNIYYQSQLQATENTPGITPGAVLLGFCSLPASGVTPATPRDSYVIDGCNVRSGTMPGGNVGGYNLGGTTAHEVGHWNGLLHTFNGGTCDSSDFGDYVADTPQEAQRTSQFGPIFQFPFLSSPLHIFAFFVVGRGLLLTHSKWKTGGCPVSKDTCPDSGVAGGSYDGGPGEGLNPYGAQGFSGPDPIHNYMDYSNDACYQGFTPGQGARMLNIWQIYREGL